MFIGMLYMCVFTYTFIYLYISIVISLRSDNDFNKETTVYLLTDLLTVEERICDLFTLLDFKQTKKKERKKETDEF